MAKKRRRRFWSADEKRQIVGQTRVPGVSISQVARRYDVNANLVFKWLRDSRFSADEEPPAFLPVAVLEEPGPVIERAPAGDREVAIELSNGHRLVLSGGFDPDRVIRLVRGLAQ